MAFQETITRRNLPHWFRPGAAHFVTYRIHGTIPAAVARRLRAKRDAAIKRIPSRDLRAFAARERAHKLFFAAYDSYLDNNRRIEWLSKPVIAQVIRDNLLHHHRTKYLLLAHCVMPNHVHALFLPTDAEANDATIGSIKERVRQVTSEEDSKTDADWFSDEVTDDRSPLGRIMHGLKSYTANRANELLGRSGRFWQQESYDHWVRNADELRRIVDYIHFNPVKAGLADRPEVYRWSTAYEREQGLFDPWKDAEGILD